MCVRAACVDFPLQHRAAVPRGGRRRGPHKDVGGPDGAPKGHLSNGWHGKGPLAGEDGASRAQS